MNAKAQAGRARKEETAAQKAATAAAAKEAEANKAWSVGANDKALSRMNDDGTCMAFFWSICSVLVSIRQKYAICRINRFCGLVGT